MLDYELGKVFEDVNSVVIRNATKNKIIVVAISLFADKGYSGVSIRDITKAVGIKESSLYKHFKSKEELIETIFHNFRMDCHAILPPTHQIEDIVTGITVKSFLQQGWTNFQKHIDDPMNQHIWRIIYLEQFRHTLAMEIYRTDIIEKTVTCLTTVFQLMITHGKLKPIDAELLAREYQYPIFTMVMEYISLKSIGYSIEHIEHQVIQHIDYFHSTAGM
ncbi:TetR/AcrR family transcriptional regulator [Paenibacillus endoradicis]|uniref:TetR/AcrR family transcriptional regulator n=1 Tax=Paenibacillus endoradicis TaxID=2972487 RepID=UPI00280AF30E|nr:TetR/AcrR family transcriptional regulator [Paenibacillus endoradicis]